MRCGHCMRGAAQNKDMSVEVIDAVLDRIEGVHVNTVVFGGGETTLVPKLAAELFNRMTSRGHYPSINVVTNGKRMPLEFAKALGEIGNSCEVNIMKSDDDMHERIWQKDAERNAEMLKRVTAGLNRFGQGIDMDTRYGSGDAVNGVARRHTPDKVLKMGRGATEFGGSACTRIYPYDVKGYSKDFPPLSEDDFYVDVDGNVWPHCDLSYKFMRLRKGVSLGSVKDEKFDWLEAAVLFNIKHAEAFPIKAIEPGYEDEWVSEPFSTWERDHIPDRVDASLKLARKMKLKIMETA